LRIRAALPCTILSCGLAKKVEENLIFKRYGIINSKNLKSTVF
jgi:hypothetical protein